MSKQSKVKARKRRNKNRKKQEKENPCSENTFNEWQLRFVAYMLEDDARDFSGVLCNMKKENIIKAKYKSFYFDNAAYTRISLYVRNENLCRAYRIMENSLLITVGSNQFFSPKCRAFASAAVTDENFCMIGLMAQGAIDYFKDDAKESNALYYSELMFYKVLGDENAIVEIYTGAINRESAIAVLDDGWLSERWGSQFQEV